MSEKEGVFKVSLPRGDLSVTAGREDDAADGADVLGRLHADG